jgi:hypothetical protein
VTPLGGEYAVAGALPGDQTFPQAAINSSGGFLVWQDNSVTTRGLRIRALRLGSDFAGTGSSFNVSAMWKSLAAGDQKHPQVALLQNGGAVVVWQGGKPWQCIYARFLRTDGTFLTGDVRVSTQRKYNLSAPRVAMLTDGSVVFVWSSFGQDGSLQGVFGRRFTATGRAIGNEFQVNQFTQNNQRSPAVAALSTGGFVVVWISELQRAGSSVDVFARIFDSSGMPVAGEFAANTSTTNNCSSPSVTGSPAGGFVVVWGQNNNVTVPTPTLSSDANSSGIVVSAASLPSVARSPDGWDILGRFFDGTGAALTDPFRCNTYTLGDQFAPKIAALGGNYMAVWTGLSQTNGTQLDPLDGIYGQLINGSGSLVLSNDLHINTTVFGRQNQPAVASDGSNRFLAVWSSLVPIVGRFDIDIFGQIYQQATP